MLPISIYQECFDDLGYPTNEDEGPVVVATITAFHARVRGSFPGFGGSKETKNVSSPSTRETQYCG